MFVIGITGGIGCGKSTVAGICENYGLHVIDADDISRAVTSKGGKAVPEITEAFGKKILDPDGGLDRTKMAGLVFKDRRALDELSRIVHRHVTEEMTAKVDKLREGKCKAVVLDVPIPVRKGFLDICDQVWVVWSDDDVRISRLAARGMDNEEARRRMTYQMTRTEYEAIADILIDNSGSLDDLRQKVVEILNEQLHMRGIKIAAAKPDIPDPMTEPDIISG
ncbi:MAG: dephospho-CoA kinase [Saccharofermentanales bacterium]